MPRSMYAYRQISIDTTRGMDGTSLTGIPFGFSNFPKEIFPVPESWAGSLGDMIFYKSHDKVYFLLTIIINPQTIFRNRILTARLMVPSPK